MAAIKDRVATELKQAMKERNATRLATLRLISAAIKDREIARRSTEEGDQGRLEEAEVVQILDKMVRQRRESANAYEEGGRLELAEQEREEIELIQEFLPRPLNRAEQQAAIDAAIGATGAASIRDVGRVMGTLKARYPGRLDLAAVGAEVRARLA